MYNQIQDKEQSDFSKNPDFNIALKKLQGLADQVKENKVKDIDEVDNFNPKKTDDPQLDSFRAKGQLEGSRASTISKILAKKLKSK